VGTIVRSFRVRASLKDVVRTLSKEESYSSVYVKVFEDARIAGAHWREALPQDRELGRNNAGHQRELSNVLCYRRNRVCWGKRTAQHLLVLRGVLH